jgi:acetoin utilization protein AcuB
MEEHQINELPVVVDGQLVGIVTDRDLGDALPSVFESAAPRRRRRATDADPEAIVVEDVMTPNVVTLASNAPVAEAARLMRRERIGAVPVVDDGRLVGIIARSDILDAFVALATR